MKTHRMGRGLIILLLFLLVVIPAGVSAVPTWYNLSSSYHGEQRLQVLSPYESWSYFQTATTGTSLYANAEMYYGAKTGSKYWRMFYAYVIFNTSSIPAGKAPVAAYLKSDFSGSHTHYLPLSDLIDVVGFTPDSYTSVTVNDYDARGHTLLLSTDHNNYDDYHLNQLSLEDITYPWYGIAIGYHEFIDNHEYSGNQGNVLTLTGFTLCLLMDDAIGADIVTSPDSGNLPLTVYFTDNSIGFDSSDTISIDYDDGNYYEANYTEDLLVYHTYDFEGNYTIVYNVTHDGTVYSDDELITVTEAEDETNNYMVIVSGVNTSVIEGATVAITYPGGSDSDDTSSAGRVYFTVPANRMVSGTVNKAGYQEATFTQYIPSWDVWTPVTLYTENETPGTGDAYANLLLTISNKDTGQPITNTPVFVRIYSDSGYTELYESGVTYTGTYNALIPVNTTYYFKLSAAVYSDYYFSTSISETTYLTKYMSSINPGSDMDGDGTPDMWDDDVDGDGIPNDSDTDDDGDGIPDTDDESPGGGTEQTLQPTIHIWAYSTEGLPIYGALVSVTSATDSGSTVTGINGTAYYFCDDLIEGESRDYTISVHHGLYTDQNATVTVSTSNPAITFYMSKSPSAGGETPVPTETPFTAPTLPEWSGTNGTPGNVQEFIFNYTIGTLGISFTASGMLLGLIICIVCAAVVGGASNSGMGAMIGGGFGWLAAGVMGYIPAWAIIVSVALVVMAFFIMRGSGNED